LPPEAASSTTPAARGPLGDETLYGQAGNDTLDGGTGTDRRDGGPDTDTAATCETLVSIT
jgi:hypothetical protein